VPHKTDVVVMQEDCSTA